MEIKKPENKKFLEIIHIRKNSLSINIISLLMENNEYNYTGNSIDYNSNNDFKRLRG